MITEHDSLRQYCRMLGHEVPFSYCRAPGQNLPCRRVHDCWWEAFDIRAFLQAHYSSEAIAAAFEPPPPKTTTLLDLIRQARQHAGNGENGAET